MRFATHLALVGCFLALRGGAPAPSQDAPRRPNEPVYTWPDVPLARSFATLPAARGPFAGGDPWPRERPRSDAAWSTSWSDFVRDVRAESRARNTAPPTDAAAVDEEAARRQRLALCALHQGRAADAWMHLADLAATRPDDAARLVPHFVLGVPLDCDVAAGLPEGVVLRPSIPPPDASGRTPYSAFTIENVAIGASRVTAQLEVRGDGVDLRYRLDEGPHVSFAAVVPLPPGLSMAVEYYDWERADTVGEPLPVVLTEVGTWYRLWGRVRTARAAWPTELPSAIPRHLELFGLCIVVPEDDPESAYLAGFASAAAELLPVRVEVVRPGDRAGLAREHALDLAPSQRRADLLRDMTGLVVRHALARGESH
jgi:hypothetical protein